MTPPHRRRLTTLLARGLRRRCPICGRGKAYVTYYAMAPRCPVCGYEFEREEGYWVGGLIVNIAVAEAWFALLFVSIVIATAPDIPWMPLLVVALVTNGLLPILFYPHSKTVWMAIDVYLHPPS